MTQYISQLAGGHVTYGTGHVGKNHLLSCQALIIRHTVYGTLHRTILHLLDKACQGDAICPLTFLHEDLKFAVSAGQHGMEVQKLMEKLYDLAGDASSFLDRLVEQKEAFAREACMAALKDATGIYKQQSQAI